MPLLYTFMIWKSIRMKLCKNENCGIKILLSLIFFLLGVSQFMLSIIEGYYLHEYSYINFNGCNFVVNTIMGGCINDIFCGICCFGCILLFCSKISISQICYSLILLHSLKIAYLIVLITFHNAHVRCYDVIVTNAPEFWSIIMLHFITGYIILGIAIIMILLYFLMNCYINCKLKRKIYPISFISSKYEHI